MKKVLIATPALDQKVDAYYTHSLCESIKLGLEHELNIRAVFLANESILPLARNELLKLGYVENYDHVVYIDADESWNPQDLIDILLNEKDVICVPVVNKGDQTEQYNIWYDEINKDNDGLFPIIKCGTGFLKLSAKVVADLYESSEELVFRNKPLKNVFEYSQVDGDFVGEDITVCNKIKELGYTIWCKPGTVYHIGNKMYTGDFVKLNKLRD